MYGFCGKLSQYFEHIYYSQKEVKHFGLEILVIHGTHFWQALIPPFIGMPRYSL